MLMKMEMRSIVDEQKQLFEMDHIHRQQNHLKKKEKKIGLWSALWAVKQIYTTDRELRSLNN